MPFRCNAGVWRTDGRTDRIDMCWCAIKTLKRNTDKNVKCFYIRELRRYSTIPRQTRQKNASVGSAPAPRHRCIELSPLPRWGSGGITPGKKIKFLCAKSCNFMHGTAVCHWQHVTKCREYMVSRQRDAGHPSHDDVTGRRSISPDRVSGTAFLLRSVIRHCRCQSSESCWKPICLFKGRGAGDLWTGALEM